MPLHPVKIYKKHPDDGGKVRKVITSEQLEERVWGKKKHIARQSPLSMEPVRSRCNLCGDIYMKAVKTRKFCDKCKGMHDTRRRMIMAGKEGKPVNGKIPNKNGMYDLVCDICGKPFQANSTRRMRCSEYCRREAKNKSWSKYHPPKNYKGDLKCVICGEESKTGYQFQILCGKQECRKKRIVQVRQEKARNMESKNQKQD